LRLTEEALVEDEPGDDSEEKAVTDEPATTEPSTQP